MTDPNHGRDKLAKRYVEHGDPKTGKKMTSEEAHKRAGDVARRVDRKKKGG